MRILVTGASGFIGRAICTRLAGDPEAELVATVRGPGDPLPIRTEAKDLAPDTDWRDVLESVDVIVHAAAHMAGGSIADYRRVNVEGTLNLARQAVASGVRRFVFLSSMKVNGERTLPGRKFRASDAPVPVDPYGISKHEAEVGLRRLSAGDGMELVIIRPALVYGPGAKGHLLALMRWLHKGYPLPLAGIDNARSLVALDDLVDLVRLCCEHPLAAGDTFMAADGADVSTTEMLIRLGVALGRPTKLFRAPVHLLLAMGALAGKSQQARKLLGNAQVDATSTRERLGWTPAVTMDRGFEAMAQAFLAGRQ